MWRYRNKVREYTSKKETEAGAMEITPSEAEKLIALLRVAKGPGYLDWADLEQSPRFP